MLPRVLVTVVQECPPHSLTFLISLNYRSPRDYACIFLYGMDKTRQISNRTTPVSFGWIEPPYGGSVQGMKI